MRTGHTTAALGMTWILASTAQAAPVHVPHLTIPRDQIPPARYGLRISVDTLRVRLGQPVPYHLGYRDLPGGAKVYVFFERDVPDRERHAYHGDVGSIMMGAQAMNGPAFHGRLSWDGRHVTCAPTDFVKWCHGVVPGRYRLVAEIFTGPVSLGGLPPARPDPHAARRVGMAMSQPFVLTGDPPLAMDDYPFQTAIADRLSQFIGGALPPYVDRQPMTGAGRFSVKATQACGAYDLRPPFAGTLTACSPPGALTDAGMKDALDTQGVSLTGTVGWASKLTFIQARDRALRLADAPYLKRAPLHDGDSAYGPVSKRGTYLSHRVQAWAYGNGAWQFIVSEVESGGTGPETDSFADRVFVRIGEDGRSCAVATRPYRDFSGPRVLTPWRACP